ncbi:MAG: YjgP/YjgQ family permease [Cytophagales bacterium]|nr:YjgP/YjgQ family permease [Cytophagales bacterium]
MKKLYKLILGAFLGPFFITFAVVVFILLTQFMMKYIEDFKGKGLDISVFGELFFYFSFSTMPQALPLAILLSCLMTYGNLGQHNELTAIKSSGISLVRVLFPVFFFVCLLGVGTFYFNDYVLPKTNLKGYRLLYDIRHKKPALDIKEGVFYAGIPGYSIRIGKKYPDGKSLADVMIYDHTDERGNVAVTVADSGYMYTLKDGAYLVVELFDGIRSAEHLQNKRIENEFVRSRFTHTKTIFDLSSFQLNNTPEQFFEKNKKMMPLARIKLAVDSVKVDIAKTVKESEQRINAKFKYDILSVNKEFVKLMPGVLPDYELTDKQKSKVLTKALNRARSIKGFTDNMGARVRTHNRNLNMLAYEGVRKYATAFACIVMFLLGAPIGAVLKKGGLGVPTLISVVFFIIYHVITTTGYKNSKIGVMEVNVGGWLPELVLLPFGLFFLYQAYRDSRLFEFDWFHQLLEKIKKKRSK